MTKPQNHINIRDILSFLATFYNTETQYIETRELLQFFQQYHSERQAFNKIKDLITQGFIERTKAHGVYKVLKIK